MSGYLRRVLSRSSTTSAPGTLRPAVERRWTSTQEPFGIGPAVTEPRAATTDSTTPAPSGDARAEAAPSRRASAASAPPQPITHRPPTLPVQRDDRLDAAPVEEDRPRASRAPEPRSLPRPPVQGNDRTTADPLAAHRDPNVPTSRPRTAVAARLDYLGEPMAPGAPAFEPPSEPEPLALQPTPAQRSVTPPRQSAARDDAPPAHPQADARDRTEPSAGRTMLVAPQPLHDNTTPPPQSTVVIGRISVVVDSPRPVTAAVPAQRTQRRRSSTPTARAAGPRFAHRFGVGQL